MKRKIVLLILICFNVSLKAQQGIPGIVESFARNGNLYCQKLEFSNHNRIMLSKSNYGYEFYGALHHTGCIISDNIIINDFKVLEDTIYFCGSKGTCGFIAKSSLSNLFANSYYQLTEIPEVLSFKKMQLIRDSHHNVNVVCIGKKSDGHSILFRYFDTPNMYYYIYKCPTNEQFDDIVATQNYTFVASRLSTTFDSRFVLRRFNNSNFLYQQKKNVYYSGTIWKYSDELLMDTISSNGVVIVGETTDYDDFNWITKATFIPNYDDTTHIYTQVFDHPLTAPITGEYRLIRDIEYSTLSKNLFILEEHPFYLEDPPAYPPNITASSVVILDANMTNSYSAPIIFSNINGIDHKYNSLKLEINNGCNEIYSAGINPVSHEVEYTTGNDHISNGNCSFILDLRVTYYEALGISIVDELLFDCQNTASWYNSKVEIIRFPRNLICN